MIWALERSTVASDVPVTIDELKDHVRVLHEEDDSLLFSLLRAATEYVEGVIGRSLVTQSWQISFDRFPGRTVRLPMGPIQSVTSIKYTPDGGTETTFDASNYTVWPANDSLSLKVSSSWPGDTVNPGGVVIEYVAGKAREAVTEDEKLLIKLLAAHWYLNPEAVLTGTISKEIELSFNALRYANAEWWQGP